MAQLIAMMKAGQVAQTPCACSYTGNNHLPVRQEVSSYLQGLSRHSLYFGRLFEEVLQKQHKLGVVTKTQIYTHSLKPSK